MQLTIIAVTTLVVTSSDHGSLADDIVTRGGDPDPPRAQRILWAVSGGAVAAVLLMTDGMDALRTAAVTTGLTMAFLLIVAAISMVKVLRAREHRPRGRSVS